MSTPGIEPGLSQVLLTLVGKRVAIAQLEKHKRSDNKVMGHARYARIGGGHHGRRRGVASSSSQAVSTVLACHCRRHRHFCLYLHTTTT